MKLSFRAVYLALILSILCLNIGGAQTRFNLKTGVETWSIKDEVNLTGKSHHSGQTIGFDMHILSNRLDFSPGFHYHRISVLNQQEGLPYNFKKRNHIHYFNIPLTVGYKVFDVKVVDITLLAGAEAFFFYNLDSNDIGLKVDELIGVTPALTGVIQAEVLSIITVDIKYHSALNESIKKRPESILKGFSFDIGVIF